MSKKTLKNYSYPTPEDPHFQSNIYSKREFYYYKVPQRDIFKTYDDIQTFRDQMCPSNPIDFQPREQQAILPNFINPDTPYKGVLLIHGVGSGKTISAILIAEQFKEQAKKYGQKIVILTPGPSIKEGWKDDLLKGTRETYLKDREILDQLPKFEKNRKRTYAINQALQNYKILSYMTFYKKVLGEKITEKKLVGDTIVKTSRKDDEGQLERELVVDRIENLDNTILIVDEAHNLTGNEYGLAVKTIKEKSKNLRIILLTGTPMKNLADDIVDLLNLVRPSNKPIIRDKIFTSDRNYLMQLKKDGEEYLKKKATGYISYYRGSAPYTFAQKIDKGKVIDGLLFTHVVQCYMEKFQLDTYKITSKQFDDALDKASTASANFVFPGLDKNNSLTGLYSNEGINKLLSQLTNNKNTIIQLINKHIFNNKINKDLLQNFIKEGDNKNITGNFLHIDFLKHFSVKFYTCINKLNKLVIDNKGPGTAFIYSNLTKAGGIEVFAECLKINGYLEFMDNPSEYVINDNTKDALTGLPYSLFIKKFPNTHFKPATFILITGGSDEGVMDQAQEEKQRIIRETFNSIDNISGEKIKFVLGSKVMNEGVTLENIKEIHILDVHYNLGKVDQVIGRGIRMCKHQNSITPNNKFPQVNVYRYVVSLKNELSSDEKLYQKAELKYLLVKKIERILRENSIDCPLLYHSNQFPEEIQEYKDCHPVTMENKKKGLKLCPAICDFDKCHTKCADPKLNFDKKNKTYTDIELKDIDYGTFNKKLAKIEIQNIKDKIKDLYRFKNVYTYDELLLKIKSTLTKHQSKLFENTLFNIALEELLPTTQTDFNNFNDTVYDKFSNQGYLIQRENFIIFQNFNLDEDKPMIYRDNLDIDIDNPIPIKNYIKKTFDDKITIVKKDKIIDDKYNFEPVMEYYEDRLDFDIVGILDMVKSKEIFKIRDKRPKKTDLKRGLGIPTIKGAVCKNSKEKKELLQIIKNIPTDILDNSIKPLKREGLCEIIKNKLLFLEKYSTSKDNNKFNYIIIPFNHPTLLFPFNLEDRIKYILNTLQKNTGIKIPHNVKKDDKGIFLDKRNNYTRYIMTIKNSKILQNETDFITKYGGTLSNNVWTIIIE